MDIKDKNACMENIYNLLIEDSDYWSDEIKFMEELMKKEDSKLNIMLESGNTSKLLKENVELEEIPKDRDCIILDKKTYRISKRYFDLDKNVVNLMVYIHSESLNL
jgi:hypothetical protein